MAILSLPRFRQCIVALAVCAAAGFVSVATAQQQPDGMMIPLISFTMNLTSGSAAQLVFVEIQESLENVVGAQLNDFLQPSSGKVFALQATLVDSTSSRSMVVLFSGEAEFSLGIAPSSVASIEVAAIQGDGGFKQLMQRIRDDSNLRIIEDVDIQFVTPAPASAVNTRPSSGNESTSSSWFIPVISVIAVILFLSLLVVTCIIVNRVRARRLRRLEKHHELGSKGTRESDSDTSESPDDDDSSATWYEDITREINAFNTDAATWLDEWARSIQSIQTREPVQQQPPQVRKKAAIVTPRPAARQSSRLTLESIDEESTNMEMPTRKDFKVAPKKKAKSFSPSQVFNPHDIPVLDDPNVPALVMEHKPSSSCCSRAYL